MALDISKKNQGFNARVVCNSGMGMSHLKHWISLFFWGGAKKLQQVEAELGQAQLKLVIELYCQAQFQLASSS